MSPQLHRRLHSPRCESSHPSYLQGEGLARARHLSKYLGHELTVIDERNKFIVISVSGVDFALCIDRVLGIQSIQQSSFQDSTKVFQNDIPNYFPYFREKEGEVTLIFKPDFFLKSEELQEYKKI